MSIILNALKKAQGDKDKEKIDESDVSGGSSGVFTPYDQSPGDKKKGPRLILFLVAFLAVVTAVFLMRDRLGITALFSTGTTENAVKPRTNPVVVSPTAQSTAVPTANLKNDAAKHFVSGNYHESAESYKKLTNVDPSNPEVYNNYGMALKKTGQLKDAKQAYQTALALNPDYPEALNNLAVIELSEHKYNEARRLLEKAVELNPDYLDAYLHLGICLEKLGDKVNAVRNYEAFLHKSENKVDRKIRIQVENRLSRLTQEEM